MSDNKRRKKSVNSLCVQSVASKIDLVNTKQKLEGKCDKCFPTSYIQLLCNRQYGIATVTKLTSQKWSLYLWLFVWFFALITAKSVIEMKLYLIVLTDNDTCGSSSLANSLGGASSTPSCTWHHSSEQLSIVVCCLHASCLQFTAVQQQKWAVSHQ